MLTEIPSTTLGFLPGLDLPRAAFQEWRSLSQILVDDRSGAFIIGSQRR